MIFFNDKKHFETEGEKRFNKEKIALFCQDKGFGFYDTAVKVCRHKDNASDNFLEILEPTNIKDLLDKMPSCHTIVTTGGKASEEFASIVGSDIVPQIGESLTVCIDSKSILWFRVPSSSRAYPMSIDKKAEIYRSLFQKVNLL